MNLFLSQKYFWDEKTTCYLVKKKKENCMEIIFVELFVIQVAIKLKHQQEGLRIARWALMEPALS